MVCHKGVDETGIQLLEQPISFPTRCFQHYTVSTFPNNAAKKNREYLLDVLWSVCVDLLAMPSEPERSEHENQEQKIVRKEYEKLMDCLPIEGSCRRDV